MDQPRTTPADDRLTQAMAEAWPRAQERWSRFLLLSPPVAGAQFDSVARIHLGTRQIELNANDIIERDLLGTVEALLAHEIGHHVRYPGSLAIDARLRLLERPLVPIDGFSVINLFTDLLINERLGPLYREQFVRIYQAFPAGPHWYKNPASEFYLTVYEELWRLPRGTLLGKNRAAFERAFPGARADAQILAQNLFVLGPNLYTQFLYFVSVFSRYIQPLVGEKPEPNDPYCCGSGEPSADDWADALTLDARELEAIRRAIAEGWITAEIGDLLNSRDAIAVRILGLPGQGKADAEIVPEIMAAYYRQQAEKYLLKPPPQRTLGEAVVPTTLDDWEPGDAVRDIDWLATLLGRGPTLGAVQPQKRVRVAEMEGYDVPFWQPRIEIYLDVSGSMPDPRTTRNAMTLAAQILAVAAIRVGGWARALLYSKGHTAYWRWCRSEAELSRFLMHYIGAGTEFPFDVLRASVNECRGRQPIRVIISDPDFDANYQSAPENPRILAEAATESPHMVLLLHRANEKATSTYRAAGAKTVVIEQMDDYPRMAVDLARSLFPEGPHGEQ